MKRLTLKEAQELFKDYDSEKFPNSTTTQIGHFDIVKDKQIGQNKEQTIEVLHWIYENVTSYPKIVKWKEVRKIFQTELSHNNYKLSSWGKLKHPSFIYNALLPKVYTSEPEVAAPGFLGFGTKNLKDEHDDLSHLSDVTRETDLVKSSYYHAAKAHWLVQDIRKNGLWNRPQGKVYKDGDNRFRLMMHPGSVRSQVIEMLDDDDLELMIYDKHNLFPDIQPTTLEFMLDEIKTRISEIEENDALSRKLHTDVSFHLSAGGYIEMSSSLAHMHNMDFRTEVYKFNRQVTELSSGKPITIYVGYDSRHENISEQTKRLIDLRITQSLGGGDITGLFKWFKPEVKLLDISKIPEYTREYANQSTEFTYSRFLIPYLENYEGFSMFVDNDILFRETPLPFLYFLNPEDAVACVQYNFDKHDETKMDGEKNVSYPKKLWSSLMVFNNSHEDCKKLTPEVINTESGKYLHQFEWTNAISEIPESHIVTEGFDTLKDKPHAFAIHYTRGGPWIKNMNLDNLNMLDEYQNMINKIQVEENFLK
tara:strand:- start:3828 stop:5435 length:1608 start_codon:yes stop_codon:yes gene_type:complete